MRLFGEGFELGTWNSNNLGHIEKSKQHLEKQNKNSSKTKKTTFGRMFGFDLCFWVSLVFFCLICWFWNGKTKKKHCFLFFWMDMINQDLKQSNKPKLFLFFQHFRFGFLHWNVSKTKHSLNSFVFFVFARVLCLFLFFFYWFTWLPFVSLCLLTLSVLGSQILIKASLSRACALCETKLGIGCAVMFMHLKINCCSAFLLYL